MRSLGRAECGRAAVHVDGGDESPHDHRRPGADQLAIGDARQRLGQDLCQRACYTHRRHGPPDDKGRNDTGLIVLGIDLERAHHHIVERHRRVDVDERGHHRVFLHEVLTEQDTAHVDGILRPAGFGHRSHEGFVAQRHMGMQHIKVTFVHRDICRLAYRPPRVMQPLGHIAQFHELLEIRHRGIAPPPCGIAHEGRAIDGGEDKVPPPDYHIPITVACHLGDRRRRGGTKLACQPPWDTHPLPLNIGPGLTPERQCLGVVGKVHADLFQHRIGVLLDDLQRLFGQHFEVRDIPFDIARCLERDGCACRASCRTTTAACPSC